MQTDLHAADEKYIVHFVQAHRLHIDSRIFDCALVRQKYPRQIKSFWCWCLSRQLQWCHFRCIVRLQLFRSLLQPLTCHIYYLCTPVKITPAKQPSPPKWKMNFEHCTDIHRLNALALRGNNKHEIYYIKNILYSGWRQDERHIQFAVIAVLHFICYETQWDRPIFVITIILTLRNCHGSLSLSLAHESETWVIALATETSKIGCMQRIYSFLMLSLDVCACALWNTGDCMSFEVFTFDIRICSRRI